MKVMKEVIPREVIKAGLAAAWEMPLATLHNGSPRIVTVFFVAAEDLSSLYWLSKPHRVHSKDIDGDPEAGTKPEPHVSAGFTFRDRDGVVGLTVMGLARVVTDLQVAEGVMESYVPKYDVGEHFCANLADGENLHNLYEMQVSEMDLFDEHTFTGKIHLIPDEIVERQTNN